jgi:hypothetical protein
MKQITRSIIPGAAAVIIGLLIVLGPLYLFKTCAFAGCCTTTACSYSMQVYDAMGLLIIALGLCIILYNDKKTQIGFTIAVMAAAAVVLLTIHVTVGGCNNVSMSCRRVTFPALTIVCAAALAASVVNIITLKEKKSA